MTGLFINFLYLIDTIINTLI